MSWIFNASGFVGLALFLWAYAMVNMGVWHESQARFHLANLAGAAAMIISLLGSWNLPIFVLELCWALIAAYGLRKAYKR